MRNGRILISGAGIAGPCLAYWLQRYGFEPVLIERAPALRTGGYLIDFWGLGFEVADKMGLVPALRRDGYQINEVRLVDARGRKAGGFSARAFQNVMGDRYLSILRSDRARHHGAQLRDAPDGLRPSREALHGAAVERSARLADLPLTHPRTAYPAQSPHGRIWEPVR